MVEVEQPRLTLNEAAYRRLRGDILACRLAPGQRFTEKQLATEFGFSTAPVRDALARLDHEGLIRTLPHKGYEVAPLTVKSIDDLFVVWRVVAPELIRIGIRQATDDQLAAARSAFAELDRSAQQGSMQWIVRDIEAVNSTFGILAEATRNEYLIAIYQRLMGDMSRIRALLLTSNPAAAGEPDLAEHWVRSIFTESDPDIAADHARRYIDAVHQRVLTAVVRWPSVMTSEVTVRA